MARRRRRPGPPARAPAPPPPLGPLLRCALAPIPTSLNHFFPHVCVLVTTTTTTMSTTTDDSFAPGTDAYARRLRRMQACVRTLLRGVGEDADREGLRDTPKVRHSIANH